jgi:hypothetical protein
VGPLVRVIHTPNGLTKRRNWRIGENPRSDEVSRGFERRAAMVSADGGSDSTVLPLEICEGFSGAYFALPHNAPGIAGG